MILLLNESVVGGQILNFKNERVILLGLQQDYKQKTGLTSLFSWP